MHNKGLAIAAFVLQLIAAITLLLIGLAILVFSVYLFAVSDALAVSALGFSYYKTGIIAYPVIFILLSISQLVWAGLSFWLASIINTYKVYLAVSFRFAFSLSCTYN